MLTFPSMMATHELVVPRSMPMTGPDTLEELKRACMAGDCSTMRESVSYRLEYMVMLQEILCPRHFGRGCLRLWRGRVDAGRGSTAKELTARDDRPAARRDEGRAARIEAARVADNIFSDERGREMGEKERVILACERTFERRRRSVECFRCFGSFRSVRHTWSFELSYPSSNQIHGSLLPLKG